MDYIDLFIEYTKSFESPTQFYYWAALASISAVLRDNCYLRLGDARIYPNVYIMVVTAKPAMRKAHPLRTAVKLIQSADNTKIIQGRISIQALVQRLGEVERHKNGMTISGASSIIYSEEVSAMFTEDDATIPILTDIYDYHSTYPVTLVSRGTTHLKEIVTTMLISSNEQLLRPVFNNQAIYGGLLSRCIIVYGDKVRHRNSLMFEESSHYDTLFPQLEKLVKQFSQIRGLVHMSQEAKEYFDDWYNHVCPKLENTAGATGAEGRIHTNILKVAILLCVSRSGTIQVELQDIQLAMNKCQEIFVNYRRLTMGSGRSKDVEAATLVLKLLWESRPTFILTRQEILYKAWADISDTVLEEVTNTLKGANLIEVMQHKGDESLSQYKLTNLAIKEFTNSKV